MEFRFDHANIHVLDLDRSIRFYEEALGLKPIRRVEAADGSFILVFLGEGRTGFRLELTWNRGRTEPYDLGENENHLALVCDDIVAAKARHRQMGCIAYENPSMGLYFITDPDETWIEIVPAR